MAIYIFKCPHCGEPIEADEAYYGMEAECPYCANSIVVPQRANVVALRKGGSSDSKLQRRQMILRYSIVGGIILAALMSIIIAVLVLRGPKDDTVALDSNAFRSGSGYYRNGDEPENAEALCDLGVRYYNGRGVPKDYEKAAKYFRKSAEQGNAVAQIILGACFANGEGVLQDDVEAVKWYRRAAEQGLAEAQYQLGRCFFFGKGVLRDEVEGVKPKFGS